MSTHQKLSPKDTPMTKLKRLWCDDFSEADRDYWREQFESSRTQAGLRQEIEEKHGITLRHDSQLKRFRNWVAERDAMEEIKERAAEDLAEIEQQGFTPGQLRDELLHRMKARALVHGDFNLALKAIAADIKVETLQLAREKFRAAYQTKTEAGLDSLAQYVRDNPVSRAAYEAFRATVLGPRQTATPKPVEPPEPNGSAGLRPGSLDAATTAVQPTASKRSEDGTQSNPIKPTPEPSRNALSINPPASAAPRPTCSATPIGPVNPIRPIPVNPTVSNPSKPTSASENLVSTHNVPANNPLIHQSIYPVPPASAEALDPYDEAYARWFRMNCGAEPFDPEELQRLYDAIPPEEQ